MPPQVSDIVAARPRRAVAALALGALLLFLAQDAWRFHARAQRDEKAQSLESTRAAALELDAELGRVKAAAEAVAADLSSGKATLETLPTRLRAVMLADAWLTGVNAGYRADAFSDRRLHAPYWYRQKGDLKYVDVGAAYPDYVDREWFTQGLSGQGGWVAPFYRRAGDELTALYSAPFYKPGDASKPLGAVAAAISLDRLRDLVEGLDLGPSGFGALTNPDGVYLYHPTNEHVLAKKTLEGLARERGDASRLKMWAMIQRGESGLLAHESLTTGQKSWLVFHPVPTAGWSLQNTFVRADLAADIDGLRRRLARLACAAIAFLLALTALLVPGDERREPALWRLSLVSSALFAAGVGAMWWMGLELDEHMKSAGRVVADRATLGRVQADYAKLCADRHAEPPVFVPTGVLIESARFVDSGDVDMAGYVWQKYDDVLHAGLTRGFAFGGASEAKITEAYRQREGKVEIIRWSFEARVHQDLRYSEYPLDQERLEIRLRHKDLDHNVVLMPDLSSYKVLSPSALPGLSPRFSLPGWRALKSYYALSPNSDATTFGLTRTIRKEEFPALTFNLSARRNLIDAFVSNLWPVTIALIILFALQMVVTSDEKLAAFMQTTAGRVVNICVSMFFVIAFGHIDVRRKISAQEILYIEWFYLVTYGAILWVALNSILFVRAKHISWLQKDENLIPKLLYWPLVTGTLFLASLATFY
jgi:hypothetical protein